MAFRANRQAAPSKVAAKTESAAAEEPIYNLPVSILVLTYNHEKYLVRALEGALAQRTNFLHEIVIAEDCSTDATHQIALAFQTAYPHKIRVVRGPHNRGTARNFLAGRQACRGKYIAILEGDDFWTDCNKLQRQFDLLEADQSLSCCFHNVQLMQHDALQRFDNAPYPKATFGLSEIVRGNFICNCSTLMMRNCHLDSLPGWISESRYYDWPLHVHNARHGAIGYIPEVMSVYRVHETGAWHGVSSADRSRAVVWLLERMQQDLPGQFEAEFHSALRQWKASVTQAEAAAVAAQQAQPPAEPVAASASRARLVLSQVRRLLPRAA